MDEIKKALGDVYNNGDDKRIEGGLHAIALRFRLLRQHGFMVSQDVFNGFKDEKNGSFMSSLEKETQGMLSLYEASHLAIEGERTLDEARAFTTKHLKELKPHMDSYLKEEVAHSLDLPLHRRPLRLEAQRYINQYERKEDMNPVLLQLAKLDFNRVQNTHQGELRNMSRWWKRLSLGEVLHFARDRLVESFFFAMGVIFESQFGYCREGVTKVCMLISVIDDVYDVYGSLDELRLFTNAVNRWEINAMEGLPNYMKICFLALYNTTNEMAYDILRQEGLEVLPYLRRAWADLCNSFLVKAKWQYSGYTPTLEEYLNNGWMSVSGHVIQFHAFFLSRQRIT